MYFVARSIANACSKKKDLPAHLQSHSAMADGAPSALVIAELFHLGNPLLTLLQHFMALHPEVVMDNLGAKAMPEQPHHLLHSRSHLLSQPNVGHTQRWDTTLFFPCPVRHHRLPPK